MNSPATHGTTPNIPSRLLRQLPRKRIERLAWQVPDTAWAIVVGVICLVLAPHDPRRFRSVLGATIDFLCASACYVAGLRLHGRIAAISAALMVATSPVFASLCVEHPVSGAAACAAIVAVAAYGAGWLIVVFSAACIAFTLGFNRALIGVAICGVVLAAETGFCPCRACRLRGFWRALVTRGFPLAPAARIALMVDLARSVGAHIRRAPDPLVRSAVLGRSNRSGYKPLVTHAGADDSVFRGGVCQHRLRDRRLYDAFPLAMLMVGVGLGRFDAGNRRRLCGSLEALRCSGNCDRYDDRAACTGSTRARPTRSMTICPLARPPGSELAIPLPFIVRNRTRVICVTQEMPG